MKELYNEDYEKIILSMLLLDNTLIDVISGRLQKECFFNAKYKYIYENILILWNKDKHVDLLNLVNRLKTIKPAELAELTDTVASTSNWEFYVSKVRSYYLTRKVKTELLTSVENLDVETINKQVSELQVNLANFLHYNGDDGAEVKNLCVEIPEEIQEAFNQKKKYIGYETGFEELDDILDGLQTKYLYVIGARPSIGKTAFALTLIRKLCQKNVPVTLFSLEMSAKACFYRMLSSESKLPSWQLKKGTCLEYQRGITQLTIGLNNLFNYDMNIIDTAYNDEELYSRIRYEAIVKGRKVFVVDHLGLVRSAHQSNQHYLDVGKITASLHALAKELDVCIILLCQLGREAEGKKPNMSLLRESGNIEQDADVIMFLHRERDKDEACIPTEVIVEKHRDGKTGIVNFVFDTDRQDFRVNKNRDTEERGYAPKVPVKVGVEREEEQEALF